MRTAKAAARIHLLQRAPEPRRRVSSAQTIPPARWLFGALIVGLSLWVLHGFLQALLAACIAAIASWPLYRRFRFRARRYLSPGACAVAFTFLIGVFVLAPLVFAFGSLVTQAHALLVEIADADRKGMAIGHWLQGVPLAGPWIADVWGDRLAQPGTLLGWAQRTDPTAILGWAQSLGQFMMRHLFIVLFTILVLFFFYQHGESLARQFRAMLRSRIGERAEAYVRLATRAVRASVNGMLVVALFDGFASGIAYAIAGVPNPAVWGAITGSLALVPFLGYVAVIAVALRLVLAGAGTAAVVSFALGSVVLFFGDKAVRPAVTREGTRLGFVWVLMGCLGGFEALGLVGLVIGPVALTLTRELWEQRVRELATHSRV
jgi:predicted PurR-regulated permease PerM